MTGLAASSAAGSSPSSVVRWLLVVVAVLAVAVVVLWRREIHANARADSARAAFEASDSTYHAYRDSTTALLAAQADTMAELRIEVGGAREELAAVTAERATVSAEVERILPTLDPEVRAPIARERALFLAELAAWRRVDALATTLLEHADARAATLEDRLARTEQRLADALQGWNAAERARRGGAFTWLTRGLALVGSVVIADRILCAATPADRILLPCD